MPKLRLDEKSFSSVSPDILRIQIRFPKRRSIPTLVVEVLL